MKILERFNLGLISFFLFFGSHFTYGQEACPIGQHIATDILKSRDANGEVVNMAEYQANESMTFTGAGKIFHVGGIDYQFCQTDRGIFVAKSWTRPVISGGGINGYSESNSYIQVDLSSQWIIVYERGNVVLNESISSGMPQYQTCTGTFKINTRIYEQWMTSPFPDDPYRVWATRAQYFNGQMAFHGASHNNFGSNVSHGCVNMRPASADFLWYYVERVRANGVDPNVFIVGHTPGASTQCGW